MRVVTLVEAVAEGVRVGGREGREEWEGAGLLDVEREGRGEGEVGKDREGEREPR